MFISKVIKDSSSNRERLESVRLNVLEHLQRTDGYPFSSKDNLKKRVHTRTGDSIEYKLAQDIYYMSTVLDGADWDDLRTVLNIPRAKKSQSQNPCDTSFQAINITELEQLKRAVQSLTSDVVAIKQENISLKSELKSEIKTLRSDLNQLHMDFAADISESRTLISTNAQLIDRVCSERLNGVPNLKSDIKQMKADIKSISDDPVFSVSIASVRESLEKVSTFDKRFSRLEKRVQDSVAVTSEKSGDDQP